MAPGALAAWLASETSCSSAAAAPRRAPLGPKLRGLPKASFYEVKCAAGFSCASKIGNFGLGHDGNINREKTSIPIVPEGLKGGYEIGCPARGKLNKGGFCEDDGLGGYGGLCYSTKRYEVEDGFCDKEDKCICVRAATAHGASGESGESGESTAATQAIENVKGKEVRSGRFLVQAENKCSECAQHDADKSTCDACPNCEHMTKTVVVEDGNGGTFERNQLGCFQRDTGAAADVVKDATRYADGMKVEEKTLKIVPHYPLWDPTEPPEDLSSEDTSLRLPFQSRREPLSNEEWILKFKEAAPGMQKVMDLLAMRLIHGTRDAGPWAVLADETSGLRRPGLEKCWTRAMLGDDIPARVDKFLSAQQVCKRMQEIEFRIGNDAVFDTKETACGAFFWNKGQKIWTCGCHRGKGRNISKCVLLNCYNDDPDVLSALGALRQKLSICAGAAALGEADEHEHGPVPDKATDVLFAGVLKGSTKKAAVPCAAALFGLPARWPAGRERCSRGRCCSRTRATLRGFL